MPMKEPPASEFIANGVAPDGKKVAFYEADRPGTLGQHNHLGMLILAVDAETGEKLTHSDSLDGLVKAGYKVDAAAPAPVAKEQAADAPAAPAKPKGKLFGGN